MSSPSKEDLHGGNTTTTTTANDNQAGLLPIWIKGRLDEYLISMIRRFCTSATCKFGRGKRKTSSDSTLFLFSM